MSKEFVVEYTDWHGCRGIYFFWARDDVHARSFAYWTLGDLIEIHSLEEYAGA
jgi:hypothetical protein